MTRAWLVLVLAGCGGAAGVPDGAPGIPDAPLADAPGVPDAVPAADAAADAVPGPDAVLAADAGPDAGDAGACVPPTDMQFCANKGNFDCGVITGTDACGAARVVICGPVCALSPATITQGAAGMEVTLTIAGSDFTNVTGVTAASYDSGVQADDEPLAATGVTGTPGSLRFTLAARHGAALGARTVVVTYPQFTLTLYDGLTVAPATVASAAALPAALAAARPGDTIALAAGNYALAGADLCADGVTVRGAASAFTYDERDASTSIPANDTVITGAGLSGSVSTGHCAANLGNSCTLADVLVTNADCGLAVAGTCTAAVAVTLDHVTFLDDGTGLAVENAGVMAHALYAHARAGSDVDNGVAFLAVDGTCAELAVDQATVLDHELGASQPRFAATVTGGAMFSLDTSTVAGLMGDAANHVGVVNVADGMFTAHDDFFLGNQNAALIVKNAASADVRTTGFAGGDIGIHTFNTATLQTTSASFSGLTTGVIVDGASSWTDSKSTFSGDASGVTTAVANSGSTYSISLTGTAIDTTPKPFTLAGAPTAVTLKNVNVEAVLPFVTGSDYVLQDEVTDAACTVVVLNNFMENGSAIAPASCADASMRAAEGLEVGAGACLHCR